MALESVTHISDLVASNPVGATDPKSEGDDHIRNIKTALLNDFAGITGAVTATHTELNRLDANLGAFLSDSIASAGGTVDVITATYSYAPALTDKTTLILRAAGANTSTTPTFNPNSLGAKTITRWGNQALLPGDIYGAGHVLILQYNLSNDVWELLNPSNRYTPISGYTEIGKTYYVSDGASVSTYDIDSNLTVSTWESVGPTGSGASHTWTGLDSLPAACKTILVRLYFSMTDTGGGAKIATFSARKNGTSAVYTNCYVGYFKSNLGVSIQEELYFTYVVIPVSAANAFDGYWYSDATSHNITMDLIGYTI